MTEMKYNVLDTGFISRVGPSCNTSLFHSMEKSVGLNSIELNVKRLIDAILVFRIFLNLQHS